MYSVGVDGCRAGWLAVKLTPDSNWEVRVFPEFASLYQAYSTASAILVDIPIGLKDSGREERRCDQEARRLLGARKFSVFPVPCRAAIYAETLDAALEISERLEEGKRIFPATWNIVAKIRQVDELLLNEAQAQKIVREAHPELCFWGLAGGKPMAYPKKKREGFEERISLLRLWQPHVEAIISHGMANYLRKEVMKDDIVDALAAGLTGLLAGDHLVSIPEPPEFDPRGLRMEMVYYLPC